MACVSRRATVNDIKDHIIPFVQNFYSRVANGEVLCDVKNENESDSCQGLLIKLAQNSTDKFGPSNISLSRVLESISNDFGPRYRVEIHYPFDRLNSNVDDVTLTVFFADMLPDEKIQIDRLFELIAAKIKPAEQRDYLITKAFGTFK